MKNIEKNIKENNYFPIYMLLGNQAYLKNKWRDKLINALVNPGDDMNYTRFKGEDIDANEIMSLAQTMPFFAEKRVIVVEESGFFKNAVKGYDDFADDLKAIPESTVMIFCESEADKRLKAYKAVTSVGYIASCDTPKSNLIATWILQEAKTLGRNIDKDTAAYLNEKIGNDMLLISNELDKLIAFTEGRASITLDDINEICTDQTEEKMFDFLDALTMRHRETALNLFYDLLELRVNEVYMVARISSQISNVLKLRSLMDEGVDYKRFAEITKLHPFVIKKSSSHAKNWTKGELLGCYNLAVDTDYKIKRGIMSPTEAVELLIVEITG